MTYYDVIVGKPLCHPWHIFCKNESEWEHTSKEILQTEERYLPKILVDCGIVKSNSEVKRNKPELCITLDKLDFMTVKWGKKRIYILIGE